MVDFERLQEMMMNEYVAVNPNQNPVMFSQNKEFGYLSAVVRQYIYLVLSIVELLSNTQSKIENWSAIISQVLSKNIDEELGSETEGIAHKDILIQGLLKEEFNILADEMCRGTRTFLYKLKILTNASSVYMSLGAAYALEASAVPELLIVREVVEHILGKPLDGRLKLFFDRHIDDFEPGHERELRKAVGLVLDTPAKVQEFEDGFMFVMDSMDQWWESMHEHASRHN